MVVSTQKTTLLLKNSIAGYFFENVKFKMHIARIERDEYFNVRLRIFGSNHDFPINISEETYLLNLNYFLNNNFIKYIFSKKKWILKKKYILLKNSNAKWNHNFNILSDLKTKNTTTDIKRKKIQRQKLKTLILTKSSTPYKLKLLKYFKKKNFKQNALKKILNVFIYKNKILNNDLNILFICLILKHNKFFYKKYLTNIQKFFKQRIIPLKWFCFFYNKLFLFFFRKIIRNFLSKKNKLAK